MVSNYLKRCIFITVVCLQLFGLIELASKDRTANSKDNDYPKYMKKTLSFTKGPLNDSAIEGRSAGLDEDMVIGNYSLYDNVLFVDFHAFEQNFKIRAIAQKFPIRIVHANGSEVLQNGTIFEGKIVGDQDSKVFGYMNQGVFYGTIITKTDVYQLEPLPGSMPELGRSLVYSQNMLNHEQTRTSSKSNNKSNKSKKPKPMRCGAEEGSQADFISKMARSLEGKPTGQMSEKDLKMKKEHFEQMKKQFEMEKESNKKASGNSNTDSMGRAAPLEPWQKQTERIKDTNQRETFSLLPVQMSEGYFPKLACSTRVFGHFDFTENKPTWMAAAELKITFLMMSHIINQVVTPSRRTGYRFKLQEIVLLDQASEVIEESYTAGQVLYMLSKNFFASCAGLHFIGNAHRSELTGDYVPGLAFQRHVGMQTGLCTYDPNFSFLKGISMNHAYVSTRVGTRNFMRQELAVITTHQLFHLLGIRHDSFDRCGPGYIMWPEYENYYWPRVSRCSGWDMDLFSKKAKCSDMFKEVCGDFSLDQAEECDCGNLCAIVDPCCDPQICMYQTTEECKLAWHSPLPNMFPLQGEFGNLTDHR